MSAAVLDEACNALLPDLLGIVYDYAKVRCEERWYCEEDDIGGLSTIVYVLVERGRTLAFCNYRCLALWIGSKGENRCTCGKKLSCSDCD